MSIDTACSSALVAAHMGVQHLAAVGGSALAAGVNLMLAERTTAATQACSADNPWRVLRISRRRSHRKSTTCHHAGLCRRGDCSIDKYMTSNQDLK